MKYPFAIMDYGIGGLGLYKLIREEFPKIPLVYFSDSGELPYGKLPATALRRRVKKVLDFLKDLGAETVLVACHSASSVIRPEDHRVIDIRNASLKAVKGKPKRLMIFGGGRTVRDGYYRDELSKRGISIRQKVAQELSILVERGELNSKTVTGTVKKLIAGIGKCDGILLACTHYPALVPEFKKHIDQSVELIDPSNELFDSIRKDLARYNGSSLGESIFLTTGDATLMKKAAFKAFGVRVYRVRKIDLKLGDR